MFAVGTCVSLIVGAAVFCTISVADDYAFEDISAVSFTDVTSVADTKAVAEVVKLDSDCGFSRDISVFSSSLQPVKFAIISVYKITAIIYFFILSPFLFTATIPQQF